MTRLLVCLLLAALPVLGQDGLLLYLPLDGVPTPAVSAGGATTAGALAFEPGRQGEAARLTADLRLPRAGHWSAAAGTVALWVRFREAGNLPQSRYLVSLYGHRDLKESWLHNRFTLAAANGRLTWGVMGSDTSTAAVSSAITWAPESWHHVAATWSGLGVAGQGAVRLYLDGQLAGEQTGLSIAIGESAEVLDLGRDSDGSPDYADGLLDEVYVYDRELPATVIAAAAARAAQEAPLPAPRQAVAANAAWSQPDRPYRAQVMIPATDQERADAVVALPLDFAAAVTGLTGQPGLLEPRSLRAVDAAGRALPARLEGEQLLLRAGRIPAGQPGRATIYFSPVRYDLGTPLQARRVGAATAAAEAAFALPDYATDAYQDAWDFDEGDDEALDNWGNKPEFIERQVADGQLQLKVKGDPWFLWGVMWGPPGGGRRPVDIDLSVYRLLEIRLQQDVDEATWTIYGRPGASEGLLHHDFTVSGRSWQTVRLNLAERARWRGRLSSFRIDPTNGVETRVRIDWVRLLALWPGTVERVETLGEPSGEATELRAEAPAPVVAGERQTMTWQAVDAGGRPVAGQPITVRIASGGGALESVGGRGYGASPAERSGLTDATGQFAVGFRAPQRLGAPTVVSASLDFRNTAPRRSEIRTVAGAAARLAFTPERPLVLAPGETTARLRVQVADQYGNPVALAAQSVRLNGSGGATAEPAEVRTDAAGGAEFTARLAPATAWTARIGAAGGGLSGESAYLCYTPDKKDWSVSIAPNGYFQHQGQGWLPLGGFYANWVGDVPAEGEAGRKLTSFVETTDAQKTAWFKFLAEQGVTALRFMLRAHRPNGMEPMDIGGKVNPELYAEALHLMDLARPFGIRFLLVLHEDYTKPMYFNHDARSRFCLPRWEGLDLDALPPFQRRFVRDGRLLESIDQKYTDPDAIACQDLYAREIVGLLKHNPQVFAYELENEMVAVPASWVNHANEVIRSVDPATPICMSHGGGGLHTGDPWFWRTKSSVDFYTYHLYPGGTTSPETDYGLLTDVLTRYGRMAGRCFLGECAGDEFWNWGDEAERRRMARDLIWFSLINGNPGCFFWNNRGYEVAEFRQARAIAEAAGVANWTGRKAPIAVLVGHPLDDDRWFRSPAGEAASRLMSRYARHYLQQGADFDFAWSADGYQATSDLSNFAPVAAPRRPIAPSEGFEALTLTRADGGVGLTYLRNAAGVKKVVTPGQSPRTMYLREIAPRSLKLALGLDPGRYQLSVTDLVSGERRECEADASGTIELGESDHDFAVLWTRR